ncbi:MAG: thioredoxin domain-containing protein [Acidaminobacteraceae bacterium]
MSFIVELSLDDYAFEVDAGEGFVLVSFYGKNCAPCRELFPIIEILADEYKGKMKFCRINVNDNNNMEIAKELKVMGLPTVIIYHHGEIVYRETGFQNKISFDKLFKELYIV